MALRLIFYLLHWYLLVLHFNVNTTENKSRDITGSEFGSGLPRKTYVKNKPRQYFSNFFPPWRNP